MKLKTFLLSLFFFLHFYTWSVPFLCVHLSVRVFRVHSLKVLSLSFLLHTILIYFYFILFYNIFTAIIFQEVTCSAIDRGAWWATVHGVPKELDTTQPLNNNMLVFIFFFACFELFILYWGMAD